MLCSECGKNQATVHSVNYIKGVKSEMHLCAECAKKHPELNLNFANMGLSAFGAQDMFKKFFDFGFEEMPLMGLNVQSTCKTCGESLADFQQSGLLGCPDCYEAFSDRIIPVLQRAHGNTQHVGEAPAGVDEQAEKRKKLYDLQEQLAKAVREENFEQAAKLRDEINHLKGE